MNVLLIVIPICSIIEAIAVVLYNKYSKRYRIILNTETSRITTLKKGFYEIKGKIALLNEKLTSPLSKAPCVYFKFKVEEQRSSGKSSHWHTIIKDEKYVRFGVQDTSGMAYIEAEGAKLIVNKDDKGSTGIFNKATTELEAALKMYGKTSNGWIFDKTLKYEETYLSEGDDLYVLGEVMEMEGYYPVIKKGKLPFLISDKSEESMLRSSKRIFQVALFFMIAVPLGIVVYSLYYLGLF